ncbi:hypothetical protein CTI12_AA450470 [Artemisia annua]|uniref:E3 ubiquitin ligase UBR4 C-terminal domain-containing protein n=1 Tax=Artemisia annua TaxID=35608 RepID=A0A2U1LUX9_ARTAN|nr:hypothetical protein CTI12_AA450470 [Artemisia annua]
MASSDTTETEKYDVILLKFLLEKNSRVQDAYNMLIKSLEWRKAYGAYSIIEQDLGFKTLENHVSYNMGCDREGYSLCYTNYSDFFKLVVPSSAMENQILVGQASDSRLWSRWQVYVGLVGFVSARTGNQVQFGNVAGWKFFWRFSGVFSFPYSDHLRDDLKSNQEQLVAVLNLLMLCCKIQKKRRALLRLGALSLLLFALDMQFMVEIARNGGHLTANMVNSSTDLISQKESTIVSAGFDLSSAEINYIPWATTPRVYSKRCT